MTGRHAPGDSPGIVGELVRRVLVRIADRLGRGPEVLELLRSIDQQTRETRGIAAAIVEHLYAKKPDTSETNQPELVQLHCWLALEPACAWVADQQWIQSRGSAELSITNRNSSAQVFHWQLRGPIDAVVRATKSDGVTSLYGGTSGLARVQSGARVTMTVYRVPEAQSIPLSESMP